MNIKPLIYPDHNPLAKLLILVGICFASFGISFIISIFLAQPIFDVDVTNPSFMQQLSDPNNVAALKFLQLFNALGLFLIPPLVFAVLVNQKWHEFLLLDRLPIPKAVLLIVAIMIVSIPLVNWMVEWNESMKLPESLAFLEQMMRNSEDSAAKLTEAFLVMPDTTSLLYNLFLIALIPALGEELLFRGVIQRLLGEWTRNQHLGIWISAFIFSALHFQFFGFLPRLMLGVLFGYLLLWSGNMWMPIIGHLLNNGTAVLLIYFGQENDLDEQMDQMGTQDGSWMFILPSIVLLTGLLWAYRRIEFGKRI